MTDDPDVRMAQSIVDYIFRRLALDFLPFETRSALGIHSAEERQRHLETGSYEPSDDVDMDVEGLAQSAPRAQELKAVATPKAEVEAAKPAPKQAHTSAELVEMQLGIQADAPCASPAVRRCSGPVPATSARAAARPAVAADRSPEALKGGTTTGRAALRRSLAATEEAVSGVSYGEGCFRCRGACP